MNTRSRSNWQPWKSPEKTETRVISQSSTMKSPGKATTPNIRDTKRALQQDVEKLKKQLRHEQDVRRALEQAFTRPLGALPCLPAYLPPHTVELLAEVAVLEEEVIRLEEKVMRFMKEQHQEVSCISPSKKMGGSAQIGVGDPHRLKPPCQVHEYVQTGFRSPLDQLGERHTSRCHQPTFLALTI